MAYVNAVALAVVAAIVLGAAIGACEVLGGNLTPADKATIYSQSISEAMNCTAFFVLLFVPLAVVLVLIVRHCLVHGRTH